MGNKWQHVCDFFFASGNVDILPNNWLAKITAFYKMQHWYIKATQLFWYPVTIAKTSSTQIPSTTINVKLQVFFDDLFFIVVTLFFYFRLTPSWANCLWDFTQVWNTMLQFLPLLASSSRHLDTCVTLTNYTPPASLVIKFNGKSNVIESDKVGNYFKISNISDVGMTGPDSGCISWQKKHASICLPSKYKNKKLTKWKCWQCIEPNLVKEFMKVSKRTEINKIKLSESFLFHIYVSE